MKTIQAVQLRKNLDEVIKLAMSGETIKVSYRNKPAIKIVADDDVVVKSNLPAILAAAEKIRAAMDPADLKKLQSMTDQELKDDYNEYRLRKYSA